MSCVLDPTEAHYDTCNQQLKKMQRWLSLEQVPFLVTDSVSICHEKYILFVYVLPCLFWMFRMTAYVTIKLRSNYQYTVCGWRSEVPLYRALRLRTNFCFFQQSLSQTHITKKKKRRRRRKGTRASNRELSALTEVTLGYAL